MLKDTLFNAWKMVHEALDKNKHLAFNDIPIAKFDEEDTKVLISGFIDLADSVKKNYGNSFSMIYSTIMHLLFSGEDDMRINETLDQLDQNLNSNENMFRMMDEPNVLRAIIGVFAILLVMEHNKKSEV